MARIELGETPPPSSSREAESAIFPTIRDNARWTMAPSDHSNRPDLLEAGQEFGPYGPDLRQLDMFGSPPAQNYDPDPEIVRAELLEVLARARAAPQEPWPAKEASYWGTVFPQMANWLPDEEAARLCSEFGTELERLGIG
jgi:hypothetical protein